MYSVTLWTLAHQAPLPFTISHSLFKLMSIESMMPSNHLMLCRPLLFLPSIIPSIRVFSNESVLCIRWARYWSFSFSISSSNEHSGLISFRVDWLDFLAVQGTLKNLLQHQSSKSINTSVLSFLHMTNLDSIFKSRDITLPTKVHLVKALVFPAVTNACESWTIKKPEHQRKIFMYITSINNRNYTILL